MKLHFVFLCAAALFLCSVTAEVRAGLNDGLALYYSFDTNEGATVTDQSGHGLTGTIDGATYTTDGISGGAYWFNGSNCISAGNVLDLSGSVSQMTVCAWIRMPPDVYDTTYHFVINKNQVASPYRGWTVFVDTWNRASCQVVATWPEMATALASFLGVSDDRWHLLCTQFEVTPDLLRARMYIDGELQQTDTPAMLERSGAHGSTATPASLNIGRRAPGEFWYKGYVDEVRIYTRLLSADEVRSLYEAYAPSDEGGPAITRLGFSGSPDGDQDVTLFYKDEMLYVWFRDVDASAQGEVKVSLRQKLRGRPNVKADAMLEWQGDGSFFGMVSLGAFSEGPLSVKVRGEDKTAGLKFDRSSFIYIVPEH